MLSVYRNEKWEEKLDSIQIPKTQLKLFFFSFFFKYTFMHFSKEFLNLEVIVPKSWCSYTSEGECGSWVFFLANAVKI